MTTRTTTKKSGKKKPAPKKPPRTVHFYVLLDRSGSMESMKNDVIGGFNDFLKQQREQEGRARMTLVQFDSQNAADTVCDAVALERVPLLSEDRFQPRGGTPLLDATAALIERVLGRQAKRRALGKSDEEVVFLTITDGEENQSRRTSLEEVQKLVGSGKEAGWNFVFLGAGLDAYADARLLGYDEASVQAFDADGEGAKMMWGSVSRASAALRADITAGRVFDKSAYFRGVKEAENKGRTS